ncbi:MAG: DUF2157 domain-containing protein [bacterium]|nr:DUF2157 domain-containing protein [bacterium]
MGLEKEISKLVSEGVISSQVGEDITKYYKSKTNKNSNRLLTVFGILGAVLLGLGIILIIAHNWDNLSRSIKTALSFVPLVIGQAACILAIVKFKESTTWKEGASVFLFFAVGAAISLVSQIYNVPGDLGGFLFIWMILCLPLVYILDSSISSILYIIGITFYGCYVEYWSSIITIGPKPVSYWLLLLAILPHYLILYRNRSSSNSILFHHWLIPLSVIIMLGSVGKVAEEYMFISYFSFYSLLFLIGHFHYFEALPKIFNGYRLLGSIGMLVMLYIFSFGWYWEELDSVAWDSSTLVSINFWLSIIVSVLTIALLVYHRFLRGDKKISPLEGSIILVFVMSLIGVLGVAAQIIVNIMVLAIAILKIMEGVSNDQLGTLNYGILITAILVTCRFFDEELSFIIRGTLFILVGVGFFASNYMLLKRRRSAND